MVCDCYKSKYDKNVCFGTREREECNCKGDKQQCDFYPDMLENDDIEFIWGVKSGDELCNQDACLCTMNDIDVVYDKINETIYDFSNSKSECNYLQKCLKMFTEFMIDNGYRTDKKLRLSMADLETFTKAKSIEDLYTKFNVFVQGFCCQHLLSIK